MNSISLTIPLDDYDALNRASDMLSGLATDLTNKNNDVLTKGSKFTDQEVFDSFHSDDELPPGIDATNRELADPGAVTEQAKNTAAVVGNSPIESVAGVGNLPVDPETNTSIGGVELDASGLPHDLRIHGAKRLKTAKDDLWKKIRNIDPALVATVEAELRQAMEASPKNPIIIDAEHCLSKGAPHGTETPPPPADEPPPPAPEPENKDPVIYLVKGNQFTAEQLKSSGWNDDQIASLVVYDPPKEITFPEFMAKLNPALAAGTVTQAIVDAALNKVGLRSLPLLSARPDFIPAVMAELF